MQNNICPECKTENEPEYQYCKNCGAPIAAPRQETVQNVMPSAEGFGGGNTQSDNGPQATEIDGNPIDAVAVFVGKNAQKIIPKFIKLQSRGTKTEWCWPPFIWGMFLGPVGVAIWFFYRKMYKPACLFGGIAIAINFLNRVFSVFFGTGNQSLKSLESYLDSALDTGVFNAQEFWSLVKNSNFIASNLFSSFVSAVYLACAILAGLFGIYIYKKHSAKKITYYRSLVTDPGYFKIGLAASGGTSPGAAILGAIIISVILNIPDMVTAIIRFAQEFYKV